MDRVDQEDEEAAWQRLRRAILECQAESAQSETGEPSPLSRARVRGLGDELVHIMDGGDRRRRLRVA